MTMNEEQAAKEHYYDHYSTDLPCTCQHHPKITARSLEKNAPVIVTKSAMPDSFVYLFM